MEQTIRFKGLNLAVDEQAVENGALAICDGMELHNGALRPCIIDGKEVTTIEGEILYIHQITSTDENVIFVDAQGKLTFKSLVTDEQHEIVILNDSVTRADIYTITSNGNTLVLLTSNGMRYLKWESEKNQYRYIGEMPPEINLHWTLAAGNNMLHDFLDGPSIPEDIKGTGNDDVSVSYEKKAAYLSYYYKYEMENKEYKDGKDFYESNETLLARENANEIALGKYLNACAKAGYFAKPFFIRYCYRLWDGRKIMHSAPVLLFTNISYPEQVAVCHKQNKEEKVYHIPLLFPAKLSWSADRDMFAKLKEEWKDIVTSIDVYVTPGISRFDEASKIEITDSGVYPDDGNWTSFARTEEDNIMYHGYNLYKWSSLRMFNPFGGGWDDNLWAGWPGKTSEDRNNFVHEFGLGHQGIYRKRPLSDNAWKDRLANQSEYYLISRINLKDYNNTSNDTRLKLDPGVLVNLEANEQMITSTSPDDYLTHNGIIAKNAYVYNNRINLTGISDKIFNGFSIPEMVPFVSLTHIESDVKHHVANIVVRLSTDEGDIYVSNNKEKQDSSIFYIQNAFLFYPDTRAREMWILDKANDAASYRCIAHFDLDPHPFLNGAYHLGTWSDFSNLTGYIGKDTINLNLVSPTPCIKNPSYIYTSAAGNPYVYPASNRYKVGMGEVKALASTTKALSQGQFGQYPLIAFATDGIWALNVSTSGSYTDIQPISREVITNKKGLLQLDQSIAFVTKRAITQLMGSDVKSISDTLSGPMRDLSTLLGYLPATKEMHDLIGAVQNAEALYDFANRRLLYFLKEDEAFTGDILVMCADDSAWAFKSLGNTIKGIYNSYPYPYVHSVDGKLIELSKPYDNKDEGNHDGIIVSRTIKSEGVRNAIRGFIQDYDIDLSGDEDKRPMLMIWGSDDNRTWHYVGKSNAREMSRLAGRIYKYFRIAVKFTGMKKNDLYHSVKLDIQERFVK